MIQLQTSNTEDDEDDEEDEDTPEALYSRGDIDVHEYKDLKAQHRVDGLRHVVELVTGKSVYDVEHSSSKPTKPYKTIGFIQ
jgi:hypothetical protein